MSDSFYDIEDKTLIQACSWGVFLGPNQFCQVQSGTIQCFSYPAWDLSSIPLFRYSLGPLHFSIQTQSGTFPFLYSDPVRDLSISLFRSCRSCLYCGLSVQVMSSTFTFLYFGPVCNLSISLRSCLGPIYVSIQVQSKEVLLVLCQPVKQFDNLHKNC